MTGLYVRDIGDIGEIAELLRRREEQGVDRFDEVWEGVLHMSPSPHALHQKTVTWFGEVFRAQARRYGLGEVLVQTSLRQPGSGDSNFRTPDVAVLQGDVAAAALDTGWIEDGAALVVEVRSPREVAMAKRRFYAERKVAEFLYINYRTWEFDLMRLAGADYVLVSPDREGFCEVRALALRVRRQGPATGGSPVAGEGRGALLELEDARGGGPLPPL